MKKSIAVADTDALIDACYPVMAELRPQISRVEFLPFAAAHHFRIAFLEDDGIKAVKHEAHYFSINTSLASP